MDTFDTDSNGLFKVHVYVDHRGFVWINFDGNETPVPWDADFKGADKQPRLDNFNMDDYSFDHAWDMNGNYNWKTLVDNYNEVSHSNLILIVLWLTCAYSATTARWLILESLLLLISRLTKSRPREGRSNITCKTNQEKNLASMLHRPFSSPMHQLP